MIIFSKSIWRALEAFFSSGTETLEQLGSVVRLIHHSQSSWRDHSNISPGFIVEEGRCIILENRGAFSESWVLLWRLYH
jgi:hypothetical protein